MYFISPSLACLPLSCVCQPCRWVSTKPGLMILLVQSMVSTPWDDVISGAILLILPSSTSISDLVGTIWLFASWIKAIPPLSRRTLGDIARVARSRSSCCARKSVQCQYFPSIGLNICWQFRALCKVEVLQLLFNEVRFCPIS